MKSHLNFFTKPALTNVDTTTTAIAALNTVIGNEINTVKLDLQNLESACNTDGIVTSDDCGRIGSIDQAIQPFNFAQVID